MFLRFTRKPTTTLVELHHVMEKYCRSDMDFRLKTEAQRSQPRPPPRLLQRLPYHHGEQINVNAIDNTPLLAQIKQQITKVPEHPVSKSDSRNNLANRGPPKDPYKIYCHFCVPSKGDTIK